MYNGFSGKLTTIPKRIDITIIDKERNNELADLIEQLPIKQKEVLILLAEGLPNKRICQQLNITEHTIKSHIKSLFSLLQVHTRTECAKTANELGLLV